MLGGDGECKMGIMESLFQKLNETMYLGCSGPSFSKWDIRVKINQYFGYMYKKTSINYMFYKS